MRRKDEITAKDDKENDENKESETDTEDEESEIESSEIDSESKLIFAPVSDYITIAQVFI